MATTKLIDNNRRTHAAKVLASSGKKNSTDTDMEDSKTNKNLDEQAQVIRDDIFKLREDLAEGYELLKNKIGNRFNLKTFMKEK